MVVLRNADPVLLDVDIKGAVNMHSAGSTCSRCSNARETPRSLGTDSYPCA